MEAVFLAMVLMLSIFLGFELISKVPATLHTRGCIDLRWR